ncbi:hypothetical protein QTN25_007818 [Entamoeba marina]
MQPQKEIQYTKTEIFDHLITHEDKKYLTQFAYNKLDYNGENGSDDNAVANWLAEHVTSFVNHELKHKTKTFFNYQFFDAVTGAYNNLAAQAAKTIRIYAVISSRGGDPDQYREYQTNENALKGLILNGEKQIAYDVWFPLSQKRSEKEEDYATNLNARDAWIGTARQFLTNNGVNPDTFEHVQ